MSSSNSNETIHTKDQLDETNFRIWKQELYLLLKRMKLSKYIVEGTIKKVDGSTLNNTTKKNLTKIDDTLNMYYASETTEEDIINDAQTKEILLNSISNDLAVNIYFISSIAYEEYDMIESINVSKDKDRIEEIKDSLSKTKYDENSDISLSIFISI